MMNEFPQGYKIAFHEIGKTGTVGMNGSEYLEHILGMGISESSFIPVQPISQHRIWQEIKGYAKGAADEAIARVHQKDAGFNLDKGSWTNDRDWVKGYEDVMNPIAKLSVLFHEKYDARKIDKESLKYRKALLYLLLAQSSDFRYWGQGLWTEYAKEICRRGVEALL
jgi:hypothetical protein